MTYRIEREGLSFFAVNTVTGWKSLRFTSASQAGLVIERAATKAHGRKAGQAAHRAAYEDFIVTGGVA